MPASLKIPTGGVCDESIKVLIVGSVPEDSKDYPEMIIIGPDNSEAFHVRIGVLEKVVLRWAVPYNVSVGNFGVDGDGTTIDFGEPFILT